MPGSCPLLLFDWLRRRAAGELAYAGVHGFIPAQACLGVHRTRVSEGVMLMGMCSMRLHPASRHPPATPRRRGPRSLPSPRSPTRRFTPFV
ncbi:hypothetical protein EYF80_040401 [Liparis tanakae]|uniref:Uncharacterized protein n=1 Tax=Liparis tanakae TaxID=230148 RepID=A0A4Z2G7A0_9TELE|nr:hypothetical protein EYF80_040401 [Liparis tanakae]